MEGNEIEKAAEEYSDRFRPKDADEIYYAFIKGANWQKERDEPLRKEVEDLKFSLMFIEKHIGSLDEAKSIQQLQPENERLNAELTRANARIEELTSQNLELVKQCDKLNKLKQIDIESAIRQLKGGKP